jgi:2-iminobutanoate/2-iminopropanoate deaminase
MKQAILSTDAPAPIGPYSQAIRFGDILFVSGQIALNPETGDLETDNIEQETHRVLQNVAAILKAADMTFDDVLKCSVFVTDMNLFGRLNVVYAQYFEGATPPARELVQVAALPKFVNIEISVIAAKK